MGFITKAGENKIAAQQGAGLTLSITHFVLANIAGLGAEPLDRIANLPAGADIMATLPVTRSGYVNTNQVVYSLAMDSALGDYDFNWVGLIDADEVLITATHIPLIQKRKTAGGSPGNNLTRNFLLAYSGIQATTAINVPAATWQIDFNARLWGIDERERLSNYDVYGHEGFFDTGWLVQRVGATTTYNVLPGIGYVGGIRIDNAVTQQVTVAGPPQSIWLDVSLQGDISDVSAVVAFYVAAVADGDYTDGNGFKHFVTKIADIAAGGGVTDTRLTARTIPDHDADTGAHELLLATVDNDPTGVNNSKKIATTGWIKNVFRFIASGIGAVYRSIPDKLSDTTVSVTDYGAVGNGSDSTAAFSLAAKNSRARINIQGVEASGIARAPVAIVCIPAGDWLLSGLVDTGGRQIIWVLDQGAVIIGYQFLNGKLWRNGQRIIGDHHGTSDYACGFTVRAHADLESGAEVIGLAAPSHLASYPDRDSVGVYVDNAAPAASVIVSSAGYTNTKLVPSVALTVDQVKLLRNGMIIDTNHATKFSGFITEWAADGTSITVSGWYLCPGPGTPATPADGIGAYINPFTKIWAHNANVFLEASSLANQATGFELGSFNNKAAPAGVGNNPKIWGYDSVNLGAYECESAFIARGGYANWYNGFESLGAATGFKAAGTGLAFSNRGDNHILESLKTNGARNFFIQNDGTVEAGSVDNANSVAYDFHSSGFSTDYDVRILASGGSSSEGQGACTIYANSLATKTCIPITDNAYQFGSSTNRWSVIFSATGTINTSDRREKNTIVDLSVDTATALLSRVNAKTFKWNDADIPANTQVSIKQRQKTRRVTREKITEEITIVDGCAVLNSVTSNYDEDELVWDVFPVVDKNGTVVMDVTGKGISVPRLHRIPVMEDYEDAVELSPAHNKQSVRTHFGFIAQDFEAALIDLGLTTEDFAGLIIDQNSGQYGLRYEQVLTILWPVVNSLVDRVNALEISALNRELNIGPI